MEPTPIKSGAYVDASSQAGQQPQGKNRGETMVFCCRTFVYLQAFLVLEKCANSIFILTGDRLWNAKRWSLTLSLSARDRKSTRLNSSHVKISYAVFCL